MMTETNHSSSPPPLLHNTQPPEPTRKRRRRRRVWKLTQQQQQGDDDEASIRMTTTTRANAKGESSTTNNVVLVNHNNNTSFHPQPQPPLLQNQKEDSARNKNHNHHDASITTSSNSTRSNSITGSTRSIRRKRLSSSLRSSFRLATTECFNLPRVSIINSDDNIDTDTTEHFFSPSSQSSSQSPQSSSRRLLQLWHWLVGILALMDCLTHLSMVGEPQHNHNHNKNNNKHNNEEKGGGVAAAAADHHTTDGSGTLLRLLLKWLHHYHHKYIIISSSSSSSSLFNNINIGLLFSLAWFMDAILVVKYVRVPRCHFLARHGVQKMRYEEANEAIQDYLSGYLWDDDDMDHREESDDQSRNRSSAHHENYEPFVRRIGGTGTTAIYLRVISFHLLVLPARVYVYVYQWLCQHTPRPHYIIIPDGFVGWMTPPECINVETLLHKSVLVVTGECLVQRVLRESYAVKESSKSKLYAMGRRKVLTNLHRPVYLWRYIHNVLRIIRLCVYLSPLVAASGNVVSRLKDVWKLCYHKRLRRREEEEEEEKLFKKKASREQQRQRERHSHHNHHSNSVESLQDMVDVKERNNYATLIQAVFRSMRVRQKRNRSRALQILQQQQQQQQQQDNTNTNKWLVLLQHRIHTLWKRIQQKIQEKYNEVQEFRNSHSLKQLIIRKRGGHVCLERRYLYQIEKELFRKFHHLISHTLLIHPYCGFVVVWNFIMMASALMEISTLAAVMFLSGEPLPELMYTQNRPELENLLFKTFTPIPLLLWKYFISDDVCPILRFSGGHQGGSSATTSINTCHPILRFSSAAVVEKISCCAMTSQHGNGYFNYDYYIIPYVQRLYHLYVALLPHIIHVGLSIFILLSCADVLIKFFTAAYFPQQHHPYHNAAKEYLKPRSVLERWFIPGLLLQLFVNPSLESTRIQCMRLFSFIMGCGPYRVSGWVVALFYPAFQACLDMMLSMCILLLVHGSNGSNGQNAHGSNAHGHARSAAQ